jgi:hypothetical protein
VSYEKQSNETASKPLKTDNALTYVYTLNIIQLFFEVKFISEMNTSRASTRIAVSVWQLRLHHRTAISLNIELQALSSIESHNVLQNAGP